MREEERKMILKIDVLKRFYFTLKESEINRK